jgi:transaldolase
MPSKLDQLKTMTIVTADTADVESVRAYTASDCTTNPSLILKAAQMETYASLVNSAILWGIKHNAPASRVAARLAVNFGVALARIVPGLVSTEVDPDLSFDSEATVAQARAIIDDYAAHGIAHDRVLIKIAATWEGCKAVSILKEDGINCNVTLVFSLIQAAAAADAGAFVVSPFVGRILDWHLKTKAKKDVLETDPGLALLRQIYGYYKGHALKTRVMATSLRSQESVEALAGCDCVTLAPPLLQALANDFGPLPRRLDPESTANDAPARVSLDEKCFRFRMNEDAMATEKLAEGIRIFSRDIRALRALVSRRLRVAA